MAGLKAYLNVMESWYGYNEANGTDDIIIDLYNKQREPGTYKMSHSDPWCHATISAAAYKSGNVGVVPNTAYCPTGVNWFKNKGKWKARSTGYKPSVGNIVYYDWSNGKDKLSDHVGVVIAVSGSTMVVREGNKNNRLEDRNISIYSASIMGYGIPDWSTESNTVTVNTTVTPSKGETYTVQRGDCLSAIAKAHNVTVKQLISWNNIVNPDIINVGQVLKVKGSTAVTETKEEQPQANTQNKVNDWVLRLQQQLNIQCKAGLAEDGIAGPLTLGATVVISYGAQGEITRLIQEKVGADTDGVFGPNTKEAVMKYQKKHKLIVDGIVGHETWTSLLGL